MAVFILFWASLFSSLVVASAQEQDSSIPSYELIKDNITATDVTVALEITEATQKQVIKSDDGTPGYIVVLISAVVFECFKGNVTEGNTIRYSLCLEAGITPPIRGTKHIVSFYKKKGHLVIPDVGYHFDYSESLHQLFEKAAEAIDGAGTI